MRDHESFQMHCQFCFIKMEDKTFEEVLKKIQEHEKECLLKKK
jgi:hypothetical protein